MDAERYDGKGLLGAPGQSASDWIPEGHDEILRRRIHEPGSSVSAPGRCEGHGKRHGPGWYRSYSGVPGGRWFLVRTLRTGYYEHLDANGRGPARSSQDGRALVRQSGGRIPPKSGGWCDGGPAESGADGARRAGQQFGIWGLRAPSCKRAAEVPGAERGGRGDDSEAIGGNRFAGTALSSWRVAQGLQAVLGRPRHPRRLHPHQVRRRQKEGVRLLTRGKARCPRPSSSPFWGAATGGRSTEWENAGASQMSTTGTICWSARIVPHWVQGTGSVGTVSEASCQSPKGMGRRPRCPAPPAARTARKQPRMTNEEEKAWESWGSRVICCTQDSFVSFINFQGQFCRRASWNRVADS